MLYSSHSEHGQGCEVDHFGRPDPHAISSLSGQEELGGFSIQGLSTCLIFTANNNKNNRNEKHASTYPSTITPSPTTSD